MSGKHAAQAAEPSAQHRWNTQQFFGRYRDALLQSAVELIQLFPPGAAAKNGADIKLCLDATEDIARFAHSLDRLEHPDFFCWVGANLAGSDLPTRSAELWMRHLSLFTDRGDRPGVYTRQWPGRKTEDVRAVVEKFYTFLVLYDLTRQWLVDDGSFKVDVDWIFQSTAGDANAWVNSVFKKAYGIDMKDVRLVAPSRAW